MDETILSLECKRAEVEVLAAVLQVASNKYAEYLEVFLSRQERDPEDYPEGFPEILAIREAFYFLIQAVRNELEIAHAVIQSSNVTRH